MSLRSRENQAGENRPVPLYKPRCRIMLSNTKDNKIVDSSRSSSLSSSHPKEARSRYLIKPKSIALTAIVAALYAVLVYLFAGISFWIVQVRVADALIPLSIIYGWPVVVGVTLGAAVSNIITPLPSVAFEVTFGSLANFIASVIAMRLGRRLKAPGALHIACLSANLAVTLIVSSYLAYLTGLPLWIWLAGIFLGSLVSINLLGYALLRWLRNAWVSRYSEDSGLTSHQTTGLRRRRERLSPKPFKNGSQYSYALQGGSDEA